MILILGGISSGRHAFLETLSIPPEQCHTICADDVRMYEEESALYRKNHPGWHDSVPTSLSAVCARLFSFQAVIATEMGLGIVPLDKDARRMRELNGRLNCALASGADCVVLMECGIPRVIKGELFSE